MICHSERPIQSVLALLPSWHDPFSQCETLLNIASGVSADEDVQSDLLTALEKGEASLKTFTEKRLEEGKLAFHDPLPKLKLKTFSSLMKETSVQVDKRKVVLKADNSLFAQMVEIVRVTTAQPEGGILL